MYRMMPAFLFLAACASSQAPAPVPVTDPVPAEAAASDLAADTAAALDATAAPAAAAPAATPSALASCKGEQMEAYIGTPISQVSQQAPSGVRIITPTSVVTQDYRPDRLNVYVDDAGRIKRLTCG